MASLQDDAIQDLVQDFLLGERRLLEKEIEGQPTTGNRTPTGGKFALVDSLLDEHRRLGTLPEQLEARLTELADGDNREYADQARDMLGRWDEFRELGQPTERRDPYAPAETLYPQPPGPAGPR